jgi:hypothetical protein
MMKMQVINIAGKEQATEILDPNRYDSNGLEGKRVFSKCYLRKCEETIAQQDLGK